MGEVMKQRFIDSVPNPADFINDSEDYAESMDDTGIPAEVQKMLKEHRASSDTKGEIDRYYQKHLDSNPHIDVIRVLTDHMERAK